jgi:hypothetical protein
VNYGAVSAAVILPLKLLLCLHRPPFIYMGFLINVPSHLHCRLVTRNKYRRCDNLIPGMGPWKQNLLTCALAAAVALEILFLWSYALRETMVPLPETVLKIVFRNTTQ